MYNSEWRLALDWTRLAWSHKARPCDCVSLISVGCNCLDCSVEFCTPPPSLSLQSLSPLSQALNCCEPVWQVLSGIPARHANQTIVRTTCLFRIPDYGFCSDSLYNAITTWMFGHQVAPDLRVQSHFLAPPKSADASPQSESLGLSAIQLTGGGCM